MTMAYTNIRNKKPKDTSLEKHKSVKISKKAHNHTSKKHVYNDIGSLLHKMVQKKMKINNFQLVKK